MKRFIITMTAVLVLAWSAAAQTSAQPESQTNAGASSATSVSAGKSGVKAQNDTAVSASQQAGAQNSSDKKGKSNKVGSANADSSQSTSAGAGDLSLASGSTLNAVLTKSVDSRKAKEGDEVTAKTTSTTKAEGQRTIPKGTKLIGHITKSSARAKGDSDSSLAILFDRAEVAKGREIPIHAVVQALAATTMDSSMAMNEEPTASTPPGGSGTNSGNSGGGLVGGTVSGVGKTVDNTANTAGTAAGSAVGSASGTVNRAGGALGTAGSTLNASSQGVVGLPGYTLDAATANATQGSVITSTGKNVKLDSGTQMVLRVVSE